ncbi:MAG: polyprenyl synthetase family protein [Aeromicrobium sp.]
MTAPQDASEFRTSIDEQLSSFVAGQRLRLEELGSDLAPFIDAAADFVAGGKRLRPEFCQAGWLVAGGDPDDPGITAASAAFEWLQGSALAHDDLMDESDTRRGKPSTHRAFEASHLAADGLGDAAQFGRSAAVLLGDLMLSWADEMLRSAADLSPTVLANLSRAFGYFDLCKTEVVAGQFLDVIGQTRTAFSVNEAMRVVRFKSAKYTIERPLHVGAALAGADDKVLAKLTSFGLPLGEAFQLRDDLLGVFGNPSVTGKPAGDDLREGKRTVLIARTAELTDAAGIELLRRGLGNADHIDALRELIVSTGAAEAVETDIAALELQAESALATLEPSAQILLRKLLLKATRRTY